MRIFFDDGRWRETAGVLAVDSGSILVRHATEIKAAEDLVIFVLTVAYLLWRWRRDSNRR
ncbi:MAG: hypothetical protein KGL39_27990 [Patescibacteria group bacterium]|nr:hypothetical protein [Patescibacteria group bacterium]